MTDKCRVMRCNEFLVIHDARYTRDYRRKAIRFTVDDKCRYCRIQSKLIKTCIIDFEIK